MPAFLFLVIFNKKENKSYFQILKLKKNKKFEVSGLSNIEETKNGV